MKFKRPVDDKFPVSATYGKWGPYWGFHMLKDGTWIKGQLNGQGQHKGIDFAVPIGTEVLAMADGFVAKSGWENIRDPKQGFGQRVRQQIVNEKGQTMTVVYGHLSTIHVLAGHQLHAGDRIGLSGNTGHSTGAHLHVELVDSRGQYHPIEFDVAREEVAKIDEPQV